MEKSRFWEGTTIGDATDAPYDGSLAMAEVLMSSTGVPPVNKGAVLRDELNELAVSGTSSPISIATGRALVYGGWYESTAIEQKAITTPGSPRTDIVVLRKDWNTQLIRSAVKQGSTTLTQVVGDIWEIPLAQLVVQTNGTIAVTDLREFAPRYQHQHLGTNRDSPQIPTGGLVNNVLSANAAGRAKMQDGFLSADSAGRAKMADNFVNLDKLASSILAGSKAFEAFNLRDMRIFQVGTETPWAIPAASQDFVTINAMTVSPNPVATVRLLIFFTCVISAPIGGTIDIFPRLDGILDLPRISEDGKSDISGAGAQTITGHWIFFGLGAGAHTLDMRFRHTESPTSGNMLYRQLTVVTLPNI